MYFKKQLAVMVVSLWATSAAAQTQIKPRVLLMLDTSGSMTEHIDSNTDSLADGSSSYTDAQMTRSTAVNFNNGLYPGIEIGGPICPGVAATTYDGVNSRMYNGKAAITNVVFGSGDVDWGLMRYTGFDCPLLGTFTPRVCARNSNCGSNLCSAAAPRHCTCASDDQCNNNEFCVGGVCGTDDNLCVASGYGGTNGRGGCGSHVNLPVTYGGACAVDNTAGTAPCATAQTCFADADCNGAAAGSCIALPGSAAKACQCAGAFTCPGVYTCSAGNFCVYNNNCQNPGGQIVVDPAAIGFANSQVLPFVDGVEDYTADASKTKTGVAASIVTGAGAGLVRVTGLANMALTDVGKAINLSNTGSGNNGNFTISILNSATSVDIANGGATAPDANNGTIRWTVLYPKNPELRAITNTPLAGTARTAATWYKSVIAADAKAQCRPYVLVQITDGFDTCDADANNGPIAAAQAFVGATIAGAKTLNKVYVVGLNLASPTLDAIAKAGGTTSARLATSQSDIEAALADIVSSSVLVEKCNNADDDCDGTCDEQYPDVALTAANGCTARAAKSCDNGQLAGTHCFATGSFVCSVDQLSEVCSAPTCATNAALCPVVETCNGLDDDCNGVIDDCTPFVPNSCCTNKCPACNPTGVPQPETCNGCDDDCDGIADNHLTDTGLACGLNLGDCVGGKTFCCQQVSPTIATCTTDPTTQSGVHTNLDKLACLGGVGPSAEMCDGTDHDCDGQADDLSRACYPFGTGTPGVGICRSGVQQCNATACGTQPNACCPASWPAGKTCPGPASYGACSGAVGPQPEVCNGIDDNCNSVIDDNVTDAWVGMVCCPTGNAADCTNTGTGARCMTGSFQCVSGAKSCSGGIAKSPEVCNGVDDDCNGLVDDNIPGNGSPCTASGILTQGICKAQYQCTGAKGPGPNGLTCVQIVGPKPEICNGFDDDCSGVIDDNLADARVGVVGGAPCQPLVPIAGTTFPMGGPAPPCNPGTTACVNGAVVCQGEVFPQANQCNGVSSDCTGVPNTNGNCPSGFQCFQGMCSTPCSMSEFPCPGGFVCIKPQNVCIPDACQQKNCSTGFICQVDSMGKAQCVDPCAMVTCPSGFLCKLGVCADNTCKTLGCPTGQICNTTLVPATCQVDPCAGVNCPPGQFCMNGACSSGCTPPCPTGKICENNACVTDPCANMTCGASQVCRVINNQPVCVNSMCSAGGCGPGQTCCGGSCMSDPCASAQCPANQVCVLDSACGPSCKAKPPADEVVGAGGGGFACSATPGAPSPAGVAWMMALVLGLLLVRLRRSALWLVVGLATLAQAGCKSNPYCLNCGQADLAAAPPVDLAPNDLAMLGPDLSTSPDLTIVSTDGMCVPTNGGVEICDHLDNDCNGMIDDVSPAKLASDPNNCGQCFNVCDFTAQHQFGACVPGGDAGVPTCAPSGCVPGYSTIPGQTACAYKCTPTTPPTEVCDGLDNDCDGKIDEPFTTTYKAGSNCGNGALCPAYDKDVNNCGVCAMACNLPGAVPVCKTDPMTGVGVCGVDHCINDGSNTYRHDPTTGNRDKTGCEYHCPFVSTTVTSGSNDCDNTACVFPAEVCNGIDDNCNFLIDDSPTDTGGACGSNCPGGMVANCVGACKAGTLSCVSGVKLCQGSTAPSPEICDGIDNDCDGSIDEQFGYPNYNTDPKNCGKCGTVCALANAVNKCITDLPIDGTGKGVCEVAQCNAGFNYAPLSPKAGDPAGTCSGGPPGPENGPTGVGCYYACPVNPTAPESCNGKDDNCDGCVDNGLTAPASFCATQGVCQGRIIPVQCNGASGWKCNYSGVPNINLDGMGNLTFTELWCDKLDNNCNGVTDTDGFAGVTNPPSTPCSAGVGVCRNAGLIQCNPANKLQSGCFDAQAMPQPVVATPASARDESCNGKDDNCDGQIDERVPKAGLTCYTGPGLAGPHPCAGWVDPMVKVTTTAPAVYVYQYEATRPDATAASQGGNSARACANGAVVPWSNVTLAQAQAACAAVKDSLGASMRLCAAAEWQAACEGPTPLPGATLWSLSAARQTYVANICNNADHPGGAVWATGTNSGGSATNFCYTDWSSVDPGPLVNRLYDLSGNLMEWTSTVVMGGGNTYNQVKGGAYNAPSGGTTCEFNFDIFPATFANSDLGFRCCTNNAP